MRPLNLTARALPRMLGAIALGTGLLVACGGSDDGPATATPGASISGVAAVGAPLVGASVEFTCVAGTPAAATTSATGSFQVTGTGVTFPCVAAATGGTVGGAANGQTLYAAVTGTGTNNVTTLTTLQLAYLAGRDLVAFVADMKAAPAQLTAAITSTRLSAALATLKTNLAALPTPVTLPDGFDPSKTSFAANGTDPGDKALDQLKASLAQGGATIDDAKAQASAGATLTERTPASFTMERIGSFQHTGINPDLGGPAEITAYDPLSKRLFVINGSARTADVLDISNPTAPTLVTSMTMAQFGSGLGGANSVAVHKGIVAMAIEASPKTNNGIVALLRASDLKVLGTATVGALPDMLTFSPDGKYLLVANEGEPNSYNQQDSVDPEGTVSLIELPALSPTLSSVAMTVTSINFNAYDAQVETLRAAGVRIFGPNARVSQDLEPEYITVSADSRKAYVTLQENNAIAIIDIATKSVTSIKPLGYKNHSLAGNGMDVSDQDASINIRRVNIWGMYQPDAIASYTVGTATYLITANEGDARDYTGFAEESRFRAYCTTLDAAVFDGTQTRDNTNLGRLTITTVPNAGKTGKNGFGECSEIYVFGARSFSIWDASITQVFDSGDQFEQRIAANYPALFNADHAAGAASPKNRSDNKGPEPEGVTVGKIGTKTFAFIGLERVGGVMVYDVSTPSAPVYVTYLNTRTAATSPDLGPEGVQFIRAAHSPNGKPLVIVGNEISGTTAIFQLNLTY